MQLHLQELPIGYREVNLPATRSIGKAFCRGSRAPATTGSHWEHAMLDNSAQRPGTAGAARADLGIQLRLNQDRVAHLHAVAVALLARMERAMTAIRAAGLILAFASAVLIFAPWRSGGSVGGAAACLTASFLYGCCSSTRAGTSQPGWGSDCVVRGPARGGQCPCRRGGCRGRSLAR